MTTAAPPRASLPAWPRSLPRLQRVADPAPIDTRTTLVTGTLSMLSVVLVVFLLNLTVVSQLQHHTSQQRLYDHLRLTLAEGSAPIGQLDVDGNLTAAGTPLALLEIPRLGVSEVVVEGTASEQTKIGVGHRRDTPLPGQAGVSVLAGRKAAYGGVFAHLDQLRAGDVITVRTGQGLARYRVIGPRLGATALPQLTDTGGRLMLLTASGRPYQPTGVLTVDAELTSTAFARPAPAIAAGVVAPAAEALAGDSSSAIGLSWLLELLVIVTVIAVYSWKRWGRWPTWIVFAPLLAATAFACADRATSLLPNLI